MISILKFKNFQALKNVTLPLGKVTVVRGDTDTGKSSIVRGIRAFLTNKLEPFYCFKGTTDFGIAMQKGDGVAIARRSAKGVEYQLNKTLFTKTAKQVPSDVSSFLGIKHYDIDVDMSILFQVQSQFDDPFLLKDSSVAVAKIIGKVSNLNVAMVAMRQMFADKSATQQELNFSESALKAKIIDLNQFRTVDQEENLINSLVALDSEIKKAETDLLNLRSAISSFENVDAKLKALNLQLLEAESFDFSMEGINSFSEIYSISLESIKVEVEVKKLLSALKAFSGVDFSTGAFDSFSQLLAVTAEFDLIDGRISSFRDKKALYDDSLLSVEMDISSSAGFIDVINLGISYNKSIKDLTSISKQNEAALVEAVSTFEEALGDVCPLSRGPLFSQCKELIKG